MVGFREAVAVSFLVLGRIPSFNSNFPIPVSNPKFRVFRVLFPVKPDFQGVYNTLSPAFLTQ